VEVGATVVAVEVAAVRGRERAIREQAGLTLPPVGGLPYPSRSAFWSVDLLPLGSSIRREPNGVGGLACPWCARVAPRAHAAFAPL